MAPRPFASLPAVRIVNATIADLQNAEVQLSMLVSNGYAIIGFIGNSRNCASSNDDNCFNCTDYVWTLVKKDNLLI
ncbi:hypothetical protein niasHS_002953 [Heterodera schachtii]|uniref:Uncharacterized protein n=1 Tax=Heterodera schachtii TaxID=97005 RepID=A0ABD2K997_HETSC